MILCGAGQCQTKLAKNSTRILERLEHGAGVGNNEEQGTSSQNVEADTKDDVGEDHEQLEAATVVPAEVSGVAWVYSRDRSYPGPTQSTIQSVMIYLTREGDKENYST